MTAQRKRGRPRTIEPDVDAQLLHDILSALMQAQGHGGLTWAARKLGLSASNMRKRMLRPAGAFDAPTMRAALLIMGSKAEHFDTEPIKSVDCGQFTVDIHQTPQGATPAWRKKA